MDQINGTVFPTAYFGNIAYFRQLALSGTAHMETCETYPKQTFRNRCTILSANGLINLSIPVKRPNGSKTLTRDIGIDNSKDWRKIHWRSIESAYASAPYFEHYGPLMRELLATPETNLVKFNTELTRTILGWLDIPTTIMEGNDFFNDSTIEARFELPEPYPLYQQVFTPSRNEHISNLSLIDALCNEGPLARKLLIR